ncbi:fused MFS/spermidine synthase [bacterium]|nr:fused MFS/spermidine synthase [bacterium]
MSPLFLLFLLSGFSGLVFEVLWVRIAALALGATVYAVSTVVASFMIGLALGGWLASRQADGRQLGVRAYALIELGIACSALLATWCLRQLPHWPLSPAQMICLASLALLLPCTLMGATIPVLSRAVFDPAKPSRMVGWLYGANTLGAMLGAFSTDILLVPNLGVWNSSKLAACLNLTAGLVGLTLKPGTAPPKARSTVHSKGLNRLYLAYALNGATALALQTVWVRLLGVAVQAKIWVFSLILATFLGCLAIGSWVGSLISTRVVQPRRYVSGLFMAIGLSSLAGSLAVAYLEPYLFRPPLAQLLWMLVKPMGPEVGWGVILCLARSLVLFALPVFLMGLAFPLVCAAALEESDGISEPIGRLYTFNTLGAVVGSLVAGFALLPWLGVQRSLVILCFLNLVSAALIHWRGRLLVGAALLCALYAGLPADWLIRRFHLPTYARYYGVRPEEVVEFHEDLYGTVAVAVGTDHGSLLLVNGTMMMGSGMGGRRYSRLMAHLPLTLHPAPKKMLVICFGLGMTFGAASLHDELESLRCVELSPSVLKVGHYFKQFNENVLERIDQRVAVSLADGRNFQLRSQDRYDVITFEPPPPDQPGVVNLYSYDYYKLCRDHLTPNGMICQWLPIKQFSEPTARRMVKSFVEVFPYSTLWEGSVDDYLIIGSQQPIHVDAERLRQFGNRFQPQLREIGIGGVYDLLAAFKNGPQGLALYSSGVKVISDDDPALEYAPSVYPAVDEMRASNLSELTTTVSGLTPTDLAQIAERVGALQSLQDYTRRESPAGDATSTYLLEYVWARHSQRVFPNNPYVQDVLGCSQEKIISLRRRMDRRPETREDLAFELLLSGDAPACRKEIELLRREFPDRPLAYFLEGLLASEKQDAASARTAFQAGLERLRDPKVEQFVRTLMADKRFPQLGPSRPQPAP